MGAYGGPSAGSHGHPALPYDLSPLGLVVGRKAIREIPVHNMLKEK
jgi:hypothetical protein